MAVTLAQAAVLSDNQLRRGVIQKFRQLSPVLEVLPQLEIEGNAYVYNTEAALPGVEFRAVNAGYSESTGTFAPTTETLAILGGDADVDRFIQRTRSNLVDQRAAQTALKVKAATFKFQDTFINGDVAVDANSFDGLKKRLTGAQVIDAGTNGRGIIGSSSSDRQDFFDVLDQLLAAVPNADALYMNSIVLGKIRSSARREGHWTYTRDDFGRTIDQYNGVPLRDIGTKADGSLIIPFSDEDVGTATSSTSIYAVRYGQGEGDGGVTGLTNGGIQVDDLGELETKPALRTRIEWYLGIALFGGTAAGRLRGVLNA